MGVFHVLYIVQMVANHAAHLIWIKSGFMQKKSNTQRFILRFKQISVIK